MKKKNMGLPGNFRYQPRSLRGIFGYDNLYVPVVEVELAGLKILFDIGIIPAEDYDQLTPEMVKKVRLIRTTDVDELERRVTKHDIRALVRKIQEILPPALHRWVHVPFTSYDPLETGRTLQYARAHSAVLRPKYKKVIKILAGLVRKYAETVQVGRTHGQHAIPITVGFWLATILSRILYNCKQIDHFADGLVGKISGAVGASNAVYGLTIAEKCRDYTFQNRVLTELGLNTAVISTQILPPEPLAYFLYSCVMLSSSFGQLGRDCRHLMRSEIAEIGEPFEEGQVGSSTMAQKRNPINFENLEGTWLKNKCEFGKVMETLISEHQRDLVGSSIMRDFPTILVNLTSQLETLLREDKKKNPFLERLTVNEANCNRNLQMNSNFILAEPIYIGLHMAGYAGDAHELVNRRLMPMSQNSGHSLWESFETLADGDPVLERVKFNFPPHVIELFAHPEKYIGNAASQALTVAEIADRYVLA